MGVPLAELKVHILRQLPEGVPLDSLSGRIDVGLATRIDLEGDDNGVLSWSDIQKYSNKMMTNLRALVRSPTSSRAERDAALPSPEEVSALEDLRGLLRESWDVDPLVQTAELIDEDDRLGNQNTHISADEVRKMIEACAQMVEAARMQESQAVEPAQKLGHQAVADRYADLMKMGERLLRLLPD